MLRILLILFLMTSSAGAAQWRGGTGENTLLGSSNASDIDFNVYNSIVVPLDNVLSNSRKGLSILYNATSQIDISPGEITVSNSDGSIRLMLHNTALTTIDFTNLDTGAEAPSTTYYIYAIAASSSATTATFKISANSTSPSGITFYKKIGSFYNNSSSDIDSGKIYTEPYGFAMTDANGLIQGAADVCDYATSTSTCTRKSLSTYYIRHGTGTDPFTITNLPYTTSSSYVVHCQRQGTAGPISQDIIATAKSATSFTCSDTLGNGYNVDWSTEGY